MEFIQKKQIAAEASRQQTGKHNGRRANGVRQR